MAEFYDWNKTLSYDADVTMVIGARGVGKTYGLRKQCIRDFLKDGSRFCEIVRFKNELSDVSDGYFNRVSEEFPTLEFKTDARYGYVAQIDQTKKEELEKEGKKYKPEWRLICYFVAMSEAQKKKKKTFDHVKRLIFDEAILERADRYHNYLTNEFGVLANLVDTISRERSDTDSVRPRVYLLGNACDLSNPYFAAYGIGTDLVYGYRWYNGKTFLLHYMDPREYGEEKLRGTVAGRMLSGTESGKIAISNKFIIGNTDFVAKKPSRSKFQYGIAYNGKRYGVWVDFTDGLYYVCEKIPENTSRPVYSLTAADGRINYIAASRTNKMLKYFEEAYYLGIVRYDSVEVQTSFASVLQMFGIR